MTEGVPVKRGRPRAFDREQALDRAMEVFWKHGYETTSMTQLTTAMGINSPSLYAAFGDKESLFLAAVDRYFNGIGSRDALLDEAPTARQAVQALLERAAEGLPRKRVGCMLVTSAMNSSSTKVRKALAVYRATVEACVRRRIERGVEAGELPADTDAAEWAKFYETVLQGMSTQAMDGASSKSLKGVAANAMRLWPVPAPRTRRPKPKP